MYSWDVISFLNKYSIPYYTEGKNVRAGYVNIRCPSCNDHSNHGGFSLLKPYYKCWRCGSHRIDNIISDLLKIPVRDAKKIYNQFISSEELAFQHIKKINKQTAEKVDYNFPELTDTAKKYLYDRGFTDEHIQKYDLRFGGYSGKFAYRIIIPFYYNDVLISYQGRAINSKMTPKYDTLDVSDSVMNIKHILFNLDNCKQDDVILVEGVMDCMKIGDNCAATCGIELSITQQMLIADRFKRVYFLFDNEPLAQKRAEDYGKMLAVHGLEVELLCLENHKDPGELTSEEIVELRETIFNGGDIIYGESVA